MSPPSLQPNVLLILADDHQADALGVLGNPVVRTPVLDGLARRGMVFSRAYVMGSLMPAVCSPSRACLFTGRSLLRAGESNQVSDNAAAMVRMTESAMTLPECFGAAGYDTFFTGKWHNDIPSLLRSFQSGQQIFHGGMCEHDQVPVRDLDEIRCDAAPHVGHGFSTELFCGAAEQFLRDRRSTRPFFACVSLTSPHDPRTPPGEYSAMYAPLTIPLPANFMPRHPFDNGELEIRDERLLPKPLAPEAVQSEIARYYGMISHHDAQLGRLLRVLEATGEGARTIVVYLSDHGLALGRHGLLGKQNLYEHAVRVPFVIAGPGVPAGGRYDRPVYSFDLFATLCRLAQLTPPPDLDSRNLVPTFGNGDVRTRESIFSLYKDIQRMVSDGRWKLIVYRVGGREMIQLFDLATDPGEQHDLSCRTGMGDTVQRLRAKLEKWQEEIGDRWNQFGPPDSTA